MTKHPCKFSVYMPINSSGYYVFLVPGFIAFYEVFNYSLNFFFKNKLFDQFEPNIQLLQSGFGTLVEVPL